MRLDRIPDLMLRCGLSAGEAIAQAKRETDERLLPKVRKRKNTTWTPIDPLRDKCLGHIISRNYDSLEGRTAMPNQASDLAKMRNPILAPMKGDKPLKHIHGSDKPSFVGNLAGQPWRNPGELPKYKTATFEEPAEHRGKPRTIKYQIAV